MKQRIKRILACMLAIVAAFTAVFSNVTPAMAVSAEAALSYWDASAKDVGEVSEIKPDFYHGKILYGLIDGHIVYCNGMYESAVCGRDIYRVVNEIYLA